MKKIKVLDCTLRDGGYYNDWNFDESVVRRYLQSISKAKIDFVEIGFRFLPQHKFLGAFAYSTDEYLNSIDIPSSLNVGVMVNAKDLLNHKLGYEKSVLNLFAEKKHSPVSLVRIASHLHEVEKSRGIAKMLKDLGYQVGFNLMQTGGKSLVELSKVAEEIEKWNAVDVLYFADSLGNMKPKDVSETVKAFQKGWSGEIGIHTHDNMGNALSNSLAAVDSGATYIDGTILGMGRGAGNVKTELLLLELNLHYGCKFYPEDLFQIVLEDFSKLKSEFNWGSNLPYYLSAIYSIHPTYVQELLNNKQYDTHHILEALEFLRNSGGSVYSSEGLQVAVTSAGKHFTGTWNATNWVKDQTVLIVAPGPKANEHAHALKTYIRTHQPTVIALNTSTCLTSDYVSVFAACHRMKILMDIDKYQNLQKPLILPYMSLPEHIKTKLSHVNIKDYGIKIAPKSFHPEYNFCVIPNMLVAAYALSLCIIGHAKKVILAGFDGYEKSDPRQVEMQEVFDLYKENTSFPPIISVTPTTYDIPNGSIYMPSI